MEIIFGLGLAGLLGGYLFLCGYIFLLKDLRDRWGASGLVVGLFPMLQWLCALAHPRRYLAPVLSQLVGLILLTPSFVGIWVFIQLSNGNFKIG